VTLSDADPPTGGAPPTAEGPPTEAKRRRVPAMAPDERRAALIEATVPLLLAHGTAVSTRQIAQAAGVAEGTIFGVFPDKGSLVTAALLQALDPAPAIAALAAVDPADGLRSRLVTATELLGRRFATMAPLMADARCRAFGPDAAPGTGEHLLDNRTRLLSALAAVIEPDRAALRRSPDSVARLLVLMVGAGQHGMFGTADEFSADEIVSLLLDGILVPWPDSGMATPTPPTTTLPTTTTEVP
jgi:AcrR family transcriptional regulator